MPQLLTVECQGRERISDSDWNFKMAVMCHECWHKLETNGGIDMWIGEGCWESLNPITPFTKLPFTKSFPPNKNGYDHEKWNAKHYSILD